MQKLCAKFHRDVSKWQQGFYKLVNVIIYCKWRLIIESGPYLLWQRSLLLEVQIRKIF